MLICFCCLLLLFWGGLCCFVCVRLFLGSVWIVCLHGNADDTVLVWHSSCSSACLRETWYLCFLEMDAGGMIEERTFQGVFEGRRSQFLSLSKSKTRFLYVSDSWRRREPRLVLSVSAQGLFMTTGPADTLLGYPAVLSPLRVIPLLPGDCRAVVMCPEAAVSSIC